MAEKSQARLWWIFIGLCALGLAINSSMSPPSKEPPPPTVHPPPPPDPVFGAPPQFTARIYAKDYLRASLRDFDSLKDFEAQEPTTYTIGKGKKALSGYLITFQFNAKNGYGGYVGIQHGAVLIKNEHLIWAAPFE